jgi:hypothetical protein
MHSAVLPHVFCTGLHPVQNCVSAGLHWQTVLLHVWSAVHALQTVDLHALLTVPHRPAHWIGSQTQASLTHVSSEVGHAVQAAVLPQALVTLSQPVHSAVFAASHSQVLVAVLHVSSVPHAQLAVLPHAFVMVPHLPVQSMGGHSHDLATHTISLRQGSQTCELPQLFTIGVHFEFGLQSAEVTLGQMHCSLMQSKSPGQLFWQIFEFPHALYSLPPQRFPQITWSQTQNPPSQVESSEHGGQASVLPQELVKLPQAELHTAGSTGSQTQFPLTQLEERVKNREKHTQVSRAHKSHAKQANEETLMQKYFEITSYLAGKNTFENSHTGSSPHHKPQQGTTGSDTRKRH